MMTLLAAFRDLQWRRRRIVIAITGTALVFALTLILAGVIHGFDVETDRTMAKFGAQGFVVKKGASGPFIGQSPLPAAVLDEVRKSSGVTSANPLIFSRKTIGTSSLKEINVFGVANEGVAVPRVDHGRATSESNEVVLSSSLDKKIGDTVVVSGTPFTVVGTISDWSAVGGVPNAFMTIPAAQKVAFGGLPIISAVAVDKQPTSVPGDTEFMTAHAARSDLLRALSNARQGIVLVSVLLWIVAATIIASVIYLSALERVRDFAVFKAIGIRNRSLLGDLISQALILAVIAALVGTILARLMAPFFPVPAVIPGSALVLLPVLAIVSALIASLAGMRRAITVEPALAFAGR